MKLKNMEHELLNNYSTDIQTSIDDVDLMSGFEFENLIGQLFNKLGFSTEVTKISGDQGIDVIAEKNSQRIGIQSKCYSGSVGNKAIQEVVAGLSFYNLNKGLVVTNNYFTDSAKELAASNNVILWDRDMLKEKLNELQIE
jgi:HJR/Mrr/RecB family endonuclease